MLWVCCFAAVILKAQVVTADLEYQKITGVGKSVTFGNGYSDPVIVCSNVLHSKTNYKAMVQLKSVNSGSLQIRLSPL